MGFWGITMRQSDYSCTYGQFTDAGNAAAMETWGSLWSDVWFVTAQALTWCNEHGVPIDYTADKEGFIQQASEEMLATFKMFNDTMNFCPWITNWNTANIHTIIDSADGGVTGNSAYDFVSTAVRVSQDHPEYFLNYHLWQYEWDSSQPWMLAGQEGTPMQHLLIAVPDDQPNQDTVKLTVKKLEAGTNQPIPGVTFTVESADGSGDFSVTRTTGSDGTFTLTSDADGLSAGQYKITETAVPEGYKALTESQLVTVMPGGTAGSTVIFYNEEEATGEGTIRKVDADNPTVGIPGAVIRITSVQLDEGGSFTGTYTTGEGGYISKEDLDFSKLPKGSYVAEEVTPPEGYILSSDTSKVKQTFAWDGKTDVSLIFENSAKVKVQLKKVDENGNPLGGCIFIVLRDGQIIETKETDANGAIIVPNVSEGYYEFREVSAPAGYDCDRSPVGVYVNAEDLQGEQTIAVTKTNYHKRSLTVEKIDAETGMPVPNTTFHIRGINVAYENDVTTGENGRVTLSDMPSGCYEVEEINVPAPYILDTNNRKTVWIEAENGQNITVTFANNKKPGLIIRKIDHQTGEPLSNVLFKVEEVNGGYSDQHLTDVNGMIVLDGLTPGAYTVQEVKPKDGYVGDDTVHVVYGMTTEEVIHRLSNPVPVTDDLRELSDRYHAEPKDLATTLTLPHYFRVGYEFGQVDQILELEFTKLLEVGVRFSKCQRCGKYFILKGNFNPRYCDRVAEGETRSCQELAAQENYKIRAADRPALAVYDRYYRRYAARKKVRQIKEEEFKKWRYEAMRLRDDCEDGKITVEEYKRWMEEYFPNRKRAEDSDTGK